MATARVVRAHKAGGPEVMQLDEVQLPAPGPGQALVRIEASGVNFIDIYHRSGLYPQPLPIAMGVEGAGTVEQVGSSVTEIRVGQRVAWTNVNGTYATHAVVPAEKLVPVTEGVSAKLAAAVMLQGMTAHYLCHSTYPVKEGDITVVHAAAGGVGLLLTQMIKQRGGVVVATTSSTAKGVLAQQAGADYVTTYDEFVDTVDRITEDRGADVVYDSVGKTTFDNSLAALRPRGMMILYGGSSGQVPPFDPQRLNTGGSLYLTRPTLGNYIADRAELLWRAGDLFEWIAKGQLDVRIGTEYPLADAPRAHEDLAARRTTGKLLLIP
jgi:NADPH:quinone reductase